MHRFIYGDLKGGWQSHGERQRARGCLSKILLSSVFPAIIETTVQIPILSYLASHLVLSRRVFIFGILIGFSMEKESRQVSILHFKTVVKSLSKFPEACQTPYRGILPCLRMRQQESYPGHCPAQEGYSPHCYPPPPWECGTCGS